MIFKHDAAFLKLLGGMNETDQSFLVQSQFGLSRFFVERIARHIYAKAMRLGQGGHFDPVAS